MKAFIKFFPLVFFIFSCSEAEDPVKKFDIDPLNELGLLEFKLFSNPSTGVDKVIEGSDDTFNYFGFGESVYSNSGGINIPKNIKTVVQFDPKSNISTTIEIDNNFIPVRFKREYYLSELDTIFSVQYNSEKTEIIVETVDTRGNSIYLDTIILSGIDVNINDKSSRQNGLSQDKECDDFLEDTKSTFVCGDKSILKTTGEDWGKYTGFGGPAIRATGKFMKWIHEVSNKELCKSDTKSFKISEQQNSQQWTCKDYTKPTKGYIRFLDTGEKIEFPGVLVKRSIESNQNCGSLKTFYSINMDLSCPGVDQGISFIASQDDYMFIAVWSGEVGFIDADFALESTFYLAIPGNEVDRMFNLTENGNGISLMAKMEVYYNGSANLNAFIPRPIEAVFRY